MYDSYMAQASLLLQVLPLIRKYPRLSLKGGTALNFFIHEFPRLSVDIDLAYNQIDGREEALSYICDSMEDLTRQVKRRFPGNQVQQKRLVSGHIRGLVIRSDTAAIKVEPNLIVRGTVFPSQLRFTASEVQRLFDAELEFSVLSVPDLYGGKICAALDRQHPRDLFDVRLMFRTFGLTEEIKNAFLIYLISHPRPMAEVLNPNMLDLHQLYEKEFRSMTKEGISLSDLEDSRILLIKTLHTLLSRRDKDFLLSLKTGSPRWDLSPISHVQKLPAVKWKMINIAKMTDNARLEAKLKLERVFKEGPDM